MNKYSVASLIDRVLEQGSQICIWSLPRICALLTLGFYAVSVVLLFYGLWSMAAGLGEFWSESPADGAHKSIKLAFTGLEFLFLAPLPFALIKFLAIWLGAIVEIREDAKPRDAEAEAAVHRIKAVTVNLMAAVVATELVSRALSGESRGHEFAEFALCGALVMALLVAYSWVLKKHFSKDEVVSTNPPAVHIASAD
ncbi:MAG TPA: hypothetical protein VG796_31230 [Verrucomicrobiales bacterium]|jgi:hypothetical protein|nr:hypothetical protein [Verrucomicrobiales bacterium]